MHKEMFCKNCGKNVPPDSKFCQYCGTKLDTTPSQPKLGTKFFQTEEIRQPAQQPQYEATLNQRQIQYPDYQQSSEHQQSQPDDSQNQSGPTRKSPVVSAILSLLIAGLGQVYLERYWRGVAWFIGGFILGILSGGILAIFAWIGAAIDAYVLAKNYNKNLGY